MKINVIAAMGISDKKPECHRVIGNGDKLPWHLPEDLAYFKKLTKNGCVIMGSNTHLSICRELPDRYNIVLTRNPDFKAFGESQVVHNLGDALLFASLKKYSEVFIIGGANLYKQVLENNLADKIYITNVYGDFKGDTYFPEFNQSLYDVSSDNIGLVSETTGIVYCFNTYIKRESY